MREFFAKRASQQQISDILRDYARLAMLQDNDTPVLFDTEVAPRERLWDIATKKGERWSITSEATPSEEEIAEAKRQYDEVVARYTNPDGTKKAGWMKAPNGKPTNLTEEQWIWVRTPNFKKWFGDWEALAELEAARDFALNGLPVVSLTGDEFQKSEESLVDRVVRFYEENGATHVNSPFLGEVILDKNGVKDSLAHGIGRRKAAAFAAVPDVIKNGIVFGRAFNWKNRGYDSAVIAAPIKIGDEAYVCEVIVRMLNDRNAFYLHEVNLQKDITETIKTSTGEASLGDTARPVRSIIAKLLSEVNPSSVSKVVDENGEPLVVYHGTDAKFNVFDRTKTRANMDVQGMFFSPWDIDAQGYGSNVRAFFLNIKNPADSGIGYSSLSKYKGQNNAGVKAREELVARGFDGVNNDNEEYIAVSTNQIKSATDNVGTFDPSNPDVRYSIVTESETIAELEASPKVTGYRTVVLAPDGTLGSPMASGLRNKGKGKQATSGFMIGAWEQAEERPELANDKGKIDLIKPSGKAVGGVDYNPYIHSRLDCVNAQFKDAWQRPDLVYIQNEIPQTDIDSGYHAEKAAKPVGIHKWNGGNLILSSYDKPIRIVPWEEVADDWVKKFKDRGVEFDIVSPQLLPILEERGVEILPPHKNMGEECNEAYKAWKENKQAIMLESHDEASTDVKFRTEYSLIESNKYGVGSAKLNGDDFKDLEHGDDFKRIEKKLKPLKGKEIKNTHLGISVRFYSNNDINHLVQYLLGMENAEAHKFAAKNIVPLLRKAKVAIVHGEKKENKPITNKWIRMFSPLIFNKGVYIATITIKESNKNIYSIASLKIDNGMSFNKGLSQKK